MALLKTKTPRSSFPRPSLLFVHPKKRGKQYLENLSMKINLKVGGMWG